MRWNDENNKVLVSSLWFSSSFSRRIHLPHVWMMIIIPRLWCGFNLCIVYKINVKMLSTFFFTSNFFLLSNKKYLWTWHLKKEEIIIFWLFISPTHTQKISQQWQRNFLSFFEFCTDISSFIDDEKRWKIWFYLP